MAWVVYTNGNQVQDEMDVIPVDDNSLYITQTVLSVLGAILCSMIIGSIVRSEGTKLVGFNLFLVFQLIPDVCYNIFIFIKNIMIFKYGLKYAFPSQCVLSLLFVSTYSAMNLWITVLIAYEIYKMLNRSRQCGRFRQPSRGVVLRRVFIAYFLSIAFNILGILNTKPFNDVHIDAKKCVPKHNDRMSFITGHIMFFICQVLPCGYLSYVTFKVLRNKLLPPCGKCRYFTLYFARIAFVPTFITVIIWISYFFKISAILPVLLSVEGVLVALMALTKKDVHDDVKDTCCSCNWDWSLMNLTLSRMEHRSTENEEMSDIQT